MTQKVTARCLDLSPSIPSRLRQTKTSDCKDHHHNGRPKMSTPRDDRHEGRSTLRSITASALAFACKRDRKGGGGILLIIRANS